MTMCTRRQVCKGIAAVMAMVALAVPAHAETTLQVDQLSRLAVKIPQGSNLTVQYYDTTEAVVSTAAVVTSSDMSTAMSSMQSTIALLSAQVSTLEARTAAPSVPPTASPTAPPTTPPTAPPTVDLSACPDGPNGDNTACARWRRASVAYVRDAVTHNCAVNINPNPFYVTATANAQGCGQTNLGSSMGFYLTGPWTKIRYTTTVTGRTSCYSMFGGDRYNYHEHTDNTEPPLSQNSRTSLNYLNQLGAEGGGLYEYNASAGDVLQAVNWNCPGSGWTCSQACSNTPHPWYSVTSNLRQMNVTLRRRYNVFANGVRQYATLAGPAVGVSCVAAGRTTWNI
eukprot:CAMPEP_0182919612 /NCGR_PEP_ID=MMETSP0105_2-20130417/2860_1 /TAXON_ID=81532 ORGANISM="Acanthoeca-like sp., Strain 10tr" /NCGR_SAMPLE_ID=MMETSP0105_2 /ASSEMBLY_ACC=CAM_ASM_000205 /LENGTH=339 /DNA_ID=CAMNT_0025056839 /DNA_START=39 /DNA_END=1055 /DNA_ORIENTATION=-